MGIVAGLTLTAAALVFQFFSDRGKDFQKLQNKLEINN